MSKYLTYIQTNGKGLWSRKAQAIPVTKILLIMNKAYDGEFGEMRVYFDVDYWDTSKNGLVYTDTQWIKEFREYLEEHGYSKKAVIAIDYSEQGMQGSNYVSLDVNEPFISEHFNDVLRFVKGHAPHESPVEAIQL